MAERINGRTRKIRTNEEKTKGLIFNIQRFSLHDGPGIRTTVFMKGCPLSCQWCSNPESQHSFPEIMTVDRSCIGCGQCAAVCDTGAIRITEQGRKLDREKCDLCLSCTEVCPGGGLVAAGVWKDVEEIVAEVQKDEAFYRNSGGGVTVSGGEPLLQWPFVRELCKECKKRGFHTALDTSGCAPWDAIEKVLSYVDLVLYDIKEVDPKKHEEGTGVTNELILANATRLSKRTRTWLRYAVIPGFNDSKASARRIAEFASDLPFEKVTLLPYHGLGSQKYERLGRAYRFNGVAPPDPTTMQEIASIFKSYGMEVTVGY